MSVFENLNPIKRKFFESIGIYNDNDIPSSFNEKILSLNSIISEPEKFCIGDYNFCFQSQSLFSMKDLVGTDHARYAGKTWLEAFLDLDRGDKNLELYFSNPNYYTDLFVNGESDLGLVKKEGKYYIFGRAGGGNNRLIIMKLKYLSAINKSGVDKLNVDKEFSFLANIRYVPSEITSENIFYLVFPDGGYETSGYYAINKSNNENIELYDIVSGYPMNTKIVVNNILGKDIGRLELPNFHSKTRKQK